MVMLQNPLLREDIARDSPETLENTFAMARQSEALLIKFGELRMEDPSERLKVMNTARVPGILLQLMSIILSGMEGFAIAYLDDF